MRTKSLSLGLYLIALFLLFFATTVAEWARPALRRNDPERLAAEKRKKALRSYLADANNDGTLSSSD